MGEAKRRRALGYERSAQAEQEALDKLARAQAELEWQQQNPRAYAKQRKRDRNVGVTLAAIALTAGLSLPS